MDGGRGRVKLEESGPVSSLSFHPFRFMASERQSSYRVNSVTFGLTTCGGCPGESETVGTSFYLRPDSKLPTWFSVDCTAIPGVSSVQCVLGQCHIGKLLFL